MATILARVNTISPATDGVEFTLDVITDEGATSTIQLTIPIDGVKGNRINALLTEAVEQHLDTKFNIKRRGGDKVLLVGAIV